MIKLFAQVIAYHSNLLKVQAEDLAFVVLAHELAHVFTIAGYDINGYRRQLLIQRTLRHKYIIDGLAQYYTEAICHQLEKQYPQCKAAFKALISSQTYPYTWHKHWFSGNQTNESVRFLLLDYRDQMNSEYFKHHLSLSVVLLNSIP